MYLQVNKIQILEAKKCVAIPLNSWAGCDTSSLCCMKFNDQSGLEGQALQRNYHGILYWKFTVTKLNSTRNWGSCLLKTYITNIFLGNLEDAFLGFMEENQRTVQSSVL